jgi:hypothetical protein
MGMPQPRRLLLAPALVLVLAALAAAQDQAGTVAAIEGTAEILHAGRATWEPLRAGDKLVVGDRVRTPPPSKAQLLWFGKPITLGSGPTEVDLRAPSTIELIMGTLRALVTGQYREQGVPFVVDTPTASGGVSGTEFIVQYDATRETTLFLGVYDSVRVRSKADPQGRHEVDVTAGLATEVARGKLPTRPHPLPAEQRRELLDATELLTGGLTPETEIGPGLPGNPPPLAVPGNAAKTPESQVIDQPLDKLTPPRKPPLPPPLPPPSTGQPAGGSRPPR